MTLTLRKEDEGGSNVPPPSSGPPCVGRPRALRYHFLEIGSASLSSWLVRAGRSAPPLLLGASPEYDLGFLDFASFGAWASGLADFSVHRKSSSRSFACPAGSHSDARATLSSCVSLLAEACCPCRSACHPGATRLVAHDGPALTEFSSVVCGPVRGSACFATFLSLVGARTYESLCQGLSSAFSSALELRFAAGSLSVEGLEAPLVNHVAVASPWSPVRSGVGLALSISTSSSRALSSGC